MKRVRKIKNIDIMQMSTVQRENDYKKIREKIEIIC